VIKDKSRRGSQFLIRTMTVDIGPAQPGLFIVIPGLFIADSVGVSVDQREEPRGKKKHRHKQRIFPIKGTSVSIPTRSFPSRLTRHREYSALAASKYENARVLTKRSRGMRASSMPVKDSRGSGAIAEFLILPLVFSSLKDRSSPRDPLVSHGEEPPERISLSSTTRTDESIFLLISITDQFLGSSPT